MVSERTQKCLIVYFSQGGTTMRVAERITSGLCSAGYEVDLCNIKDAARPSVIGYDLVGIGLPAYAFRPPFTMLDYVNSLPDLRGIPVFVFVLFGTIVGDAGNIIRKMLIRKGAKEAGYFCCRGADYYLGYLIEGYLFSADHPTKEELDQANSFGCRVATRVNKGDFRSEPFDPALPSLVYRLERLLTNRLFVRLIYSRMFLVKRKKCTSCGICIKTCPAGNINADKNGMPLWGRSCIFCFYCDLKCPQEAIMSPVRSLFAYRIFHIYNIRQALKYPALDYARVALKAGRAKRIQ